MRRLEKIMKNDLDSYERMRVVIYICLPLFASLYGSMRDRH